MSYISNLFQIFVVFVIYLAIITFIDIKFIIEIYVRFIVIISVLGFIGAVVVFSLNLEPGFIYNAHDGRQGFFFYSTFTNTYFSMGRSIIRFSGLFDEPGTLTFYATYALLMNKMVLKNKKYELCLLILPVFTLSIAYFIIIAFYFLLFKIKSVKTFAILILLISFFYSILQQTKGTDLDRLHKLTIQRFEKDNSGEFKGDNRSEMLENALLYMKDKPIAGHGKSYFEQNNIFIGANILYIGALYGVIGYIVLFVFLWFSCYCCMSNKKIFINGLKCCFILVVLFIQRPDVTNIFQLSSLLLFMLSVYSHIQCKQQRNLLLH
jgi:hypothetical protein